MEGWTDEGRSIHIRQHETDTCTTPGTYITNPSNPFNQSMFRATSSLRLYTVCVNKLCRIIRCKLYWDGWVDVRMYVNLFRREGSDRVSSDQAACKRVASPFDTTFELLTYYSETTCLQLFHHNSDRQNRTASTIHTRFTKNQTCFQPRHPAQIFCNHSAG